MSTNTALPESAGNQGITTALDKLRKNNFAERVHITPDLPEKKYKNAISSMKIPEGSNILVNVDDSLTASAKVGVCVTADTLWWKQFLNKGSVRFEDIKHLDTDLFPKKAFKINDKEIPLTTFAEKDIRPFFKFITEMRRL